MGVEKSRVFIVTVVAKDTDLTKNVITVKAEKQILAQSVMVQENLIIKNKNK